MPGQNYLTDTDEGPTPHCGICNTDLRPAEDYVTATTELREHLEESHGFIDRA